MRARVRPAAQNGVTTELEPGRTVTPPTPASQPRQAASDEARSNASAAPSPASDPAGRAVLDALVQQEDHGAPDNRSALLRFRAYTRGRSLPAAYSDADTNLEL